MKRPDSGTAKPITDLEKEPHKTFIFPEAIFTAVTAYQNQLVSVSLCFSLPLSFHSLRCSSSFCFSLCFFYSTGACSDVHRLRSPWDPSFSVIVSCPPTKDYKLKLLSYCLIWHCLYLDEAREFMIGIIRFPKRFYLYL